MPLSDLNSSLSDSSMTQHFPFVPPATPNTHIYCEHIYLIWAGTTVSYKLLKDVAVYAEAK